MLCLTAFNCLARQAYIVCLWVCSLFSDLRVEARVLADGVVASGEAL